MQRLTFHRYLEKYVYSLSDSRTTSIYKLVKELSHNSRLVEPLFLYAISSNKVDLLLRASSAGPMHKEYQNLANRFCLKGILKALEEHSPTLGEGYHKVYNSFVRMRDSHIVDSDTKLLIHRRIRVLQGEFGISNYRLYNDLQLNPGNVNAFLKRAEISKVSMSTALRMLEHIENKLVGVS